MFSGIVEEVGQILAIEKEGSNVHLKVKCSFTKELKVDQSVAHNGVCLTVTKIQDDGYWVTAIKETLDITNISDLKTNSIVNLERCLELGQRIDGHMVQGHVDCTGECIEIEKLDGSTIFHFQYSHNQLTVAKGSICINGVSLTVVNSEKDKFSVAIIPYTFENTTFNQITVGSLVNLEFDFMGKYIQRYMDQYLATKNL